MEGEAVGGGEEEESGGERGDRGRNRKAMLMEQRGRGWEVRSSRIECHCAMRQKGHPNKTVREAGVWWRGHHGRGKEKALIEAQNERSRMEEPQRKWRGRGTAGGRSRARGRGSGRHGG